MVKSGVLLLLLIPLLSACAVMPTGPSVMVLPGVGKPFDQFQADDMGCRQFAQTQTDIPPGAAGRQSTSRSLQRRYDVSYMQCMYAKGHQVPGTSSAPQSSYVPPPPGTPPPPNGEPRPPVTVPPPR